jgi:hypothetical protein
VIDADLRNAVRRMVGADASPGDVIWPVWI